MDSVRHLGSLLNAHIIFVSSSFTYHLSFISSFSAFITHPDLEQQCRHGAHQSRDYGDADDFACAHTGRCAYLTDARTNTIADDFTATVDQGIFRLSWAIAESTNANEFLTKLASGIRRATGSQKRVPAHAESCNIFHSPFAIRQSRVPCALVDIGQPQYALLRTRSDEDDFLFH